MSVRNFRCLKDISVSLGSLTGCIGINGSGKSASLLSIASFYGIGDSIRSEDWYGGRLDEPIEVEVTFGEVSDDEAAELSGYVSEDHQLRLVRVWTNDSGSVKDAMHGYRFSCADFRAVREAQTGVRDMYNELADSGAFPGLAKATSQEQAEERMAEWEHAHPERCEWIRDGGKFFGWKQVGGAKLASISKCVYVPAVREAQEDAVERRGSALEQVIDLVLREKLAANRRMQVLRSSTEKEFRELLSDARPDLEDAAGELSQFLSDLTPGSSVRLDWGSDQTRLPDWPLVEARLVEEGVESPVWAKGHGLQRSFIVSLLQYLAELQGAQAREETDPASRTHTIFLIEEPELYQHPLAAKRFAGVLRKLADEGRAQIAYSTHHPEFISFEHFDSIRRFSKTEADQDQPPQTRIDQLTLQNVADQLRELWQLDPAAVTEESTRRRLKAVMTPHVSEGFFSKRVVLVEGEQDVALIEGFAKERGIDLAELGVSVIDVGGKGKLDRPLIVLKGFGIPVYVVWDGDVSDERHKDLQRKTNRILSRLAGLAETDFPQTTIYQTGAVFEDRIEVELKSALRDNYDALIAETAEALAIPADRDVLKTPFACEEFAQRVESAGLAVPVFSQILDHIEAFAV